MGWPPARQRVGGVWCKKKKGTESRNGGHEQANPWALESSVAAVAFPGVPNILSYREELVVDAGLGRRADRGRSDGHALVSPCAELSAPSKTEGDMHQGATTRASWAVSRGIGDSRVTAPQAAMISPGGELRCLASAMVAGEKWT